jgi:hypothetical protein
VVGEVSSFNHVPIISIPCPSAHSREPARQRVETPAECGGDEVHRREGSLIRDAMSRRPPSRGIAITLITVIVPSIQGEACSPFDDK